MQTSRQSLVLLAKTSTFLFELTVPLSQEAKHCLFGGWFLGLSSVHDGRSGRKAMRWGQVAVELDWSTLFDDYLICGRDGHS